MLNSISVDTEEYYHATNIEAITGRKCWDSLPSRVEESIDRILELFNSSGVKGTFFVLGTIAEKHPQMIKKLAIEGHEVASHGFSHRLVYDQSPQEFFEDISASKKLLEDLIGNAVLGYRASNFSITDRSPWAYEKLIDAGYIYDSSLYPIRHPRYGNINKPRSPFIVELDNRKLFVLPLATVSISLLKKEIRLPVAGGAYWRLFPLWYLTWGLKSIASGGQTPCNCYFHPWEIDAEQPRFNELSILTKIRHYTGIRNLPKKIEVILENLKFAPVIDVAREYFREQFPSNI